MTIPQYQPHTGNNEKEAVSDVIDSGWISPKGNTVQQFEKDMETFLDTSHALAVDSGTAALQLAMEAAGIGSGDTVIIQDWTYPSAALAAQNLGADVQLIDIDPETWGPDPGQVREHAEHADALITTHLFGRPAQMDQLETVCNNQTLTHIEDACQALGATHRNRKTGTIGDIGCFSFSWNKPVTTGKGGMIVTDQETLYRNAQQLADYGREEGKTHIFETNGYNYRIDSIRAAIGRKQLATLEKRQEKKETLYTLYSTLLEDTPAHTPPIDSRSHVTPTPYMYPIQHSQRDTLKKTLAEQDIATRTFTPPLHTQPALDQANIPQTNKTTEKQAATTLILPSHPQLTEKQVETVSNTINEALPL